MSTNPQPAKVRSDSEVLKGLCARILMPSTICAADAKITPEEEKLLMDWLGVTLNGMVALEDDLVSGGRTPLPQAREQMLKEMKAMNKSIKAIFSPETAIGDLKQTLTALVDSFFRIKDLDKREEKAWSQCITENLDDGASLWAEESLDGQGESMSAKDQETVLSVLDSLKSKPESQERVLKAAGFPGGTMESTKQSLAGGAELSSFNEDLKDKWEMLKEYVRSRESDRTDSEIPPSCRTQ